jgi:hypothetical protein
MHQQPSSPRKIAGTHFYYRVDRSQGHSAVGRIRSLEKSNSLIRTPREQMTILNAVADCRYRNVTGMSLAS